MIRFEHKGDFSKLTKFLESIKHITKNSHLDKYGRMGCQALASTTPIDDGDTAASWYYEIKMTTNSTEVIFLNSHVNKGVPIAIILQYGHGTRNGGWVEGRDYINPAIQPIFDQMVEEMWKEVINL